MLSSPTLIDGAVVFGKDNGDWSVVTENLKGFNISVFLLSVFFELCPRFILNVLHFECWKGVKRISEIIKMKQNNNQRVVFLENWDFEV
jgi:hypothetical protein